MPEKVDVLLVENDPSDLELILHVLSKESLKPRIKVVRDGAEALDFLFCKGRYSDRDINHSPKAIILDLKLPKVTGLEVLQKIKSEPATHHIPVTILSSSNHEQDINKAYELGVNSYVVKPVHFDEFTERIRAVGHYWLVSNQTPL